MSLNIVKNVNELKQALSDQNISQKIFANSFYRETVNYKASELDLEQHYERFKKLINANDEKSRAPERIAFYIYYFNHKYRVDGMYTQADRQAAWQMFVQLDTRIATRKLENGQCAAAVKSLADLFAKHREISEKYGADCRSYYQTVNNFFEVDLRPFTSKWHKKEEDIDSKIFRRELEEELRPKLCELKDKLNEMAM